MTQDRVIDLPGTGGPKADGHTNPIELSKMDGPKLDWPAMDLSGVDGPTKD